ncbi:MAG: hypothetical protein KBG29_02665 [Pseudomonadales bacterium]|nr:hypothetical protein [Pseudomonadales bacterium]
MTRRINALLRDYVDLTAWSAKAGHITTYAAACRMAAAGVPIETALRKLAGRRA